MSEETPDVLGPIEELKASDAYKMICADYLRAVAKLVEQGAVEAFDLGWSLQYMKPHGKVVTAASFMTGPVEMEFQAKIQAFQAEQAKKISVVDVSEQLKEHQPCTGKAKEDCALCNDKLS